ncbi:hypothetical protein AB0K15_39470 [Amycolatopsis sp. NPDC049253]|uniref:hypothetical protein n=1 Tax=Amycolatopsis sp. NPDC049253 TaxID=3155274 RepID=UPI0034152265
MTAKAEHRPLSPDEPPGAADVSTIPTLHPGDDITGGTPVPFAHPARLAVRSRR